MREDYIIKIDGVQLQDGEQNKISLYTKGSFVKKGDNYFISYKETAATGFEGNTTTVKVEKADKVSLLRYGNAPSTLVVEKGRRHLCHYDTGYGPVLLGISADAIETALDDCGGSVNFSYSLDLNAQDLSENTVKITVTQI